MFLVCEKIQLQDISNIRKKMHMMFHAEVVLSLFTWRIGVFPQYADFFRRNRVTVMPHPVCGQNGIQNASSFRSYRCKNFVTTTKRSSFCCGARRPLCTDFLYYSSLCTITSYTHHTNLDFSWQLSHTYPSINASKFMYFRNILRSNRPSW